MLTRLLQAAIMAVWAVFFLWLFAVDQPTLARLLHPRLWWLVLGGAMVLIIFCGLALSRLRMPPSPPPALDLARLPGTAGAAVLFLADAVGTF